MLVASPPLNIRVVVAVAMSYFVVNNENFDKHISLLVPSTGCLAISLRLAEPDVYLIAGWSDRVFDVLSAIDNCEDAISIINNIEI